MGRHHTITLNAQCELFELHAERGGESSLEVARGLEETLRLLHRQADGSNAEPDSDRGHSGYGSVAAGTGGNMYIAYAMSALGLLKHKQAIALEQKHSRQQDQQKQQAGSGATTGSPAASGVTAESQRLRNEAEALYRNALETQTALHGRNHAYSTKTAQRLESLRRGGDHAHCPYSLA